MVNSRQDFLFYTATDDHLLRELMPPSILPKLREASFLWLGRPENHHLSFAQVVFTDPNAAAAFANHFNDEPKEFVRTGEPGSKKTFVPVEREMKVNTRYKHGPTQTVTANKDFPGQETYDEDPTVRMTTSVEHRLIYSVGICGRHLTENMIERAFGARVYDKGQLNMMHDALLNQIDGPSPA